MATDTRNINLVISAKDKATAALKRLGAEVGLLGISLAALGAAGLKLGEGAARGLDLQRGFMRSFGKDVKGNLDSLRESSKGTISDIELMASSNRASLLGVTSSIDELNAIMAASRVLGKDMGISMTQAFDNIVTGVGRGSPLILDNLGVLIPDAVKESIKQFDEATQKQLVMQEVVKQGSSLLQQYGGDTVTAADKIAQMKVSFKNAATAAGAALLPAIMKISNVVTPLINQFANFIKTNQGLINTILKVVGVMASLGAAFFIAGKIIAVISAIGAFVKALQVMSAAALATQASMGVLGIAIAVLGLIIGRAVTKSVDMSSNMNATSDAMVDVSKNAVSTGKNLGGLSSKGAKAAKDLAKAFSEAKKRVQELNDEIKKENEAFNEQLIDIVDRRKDAIKSNKALLDDERKAFEEAQKAMTEDHEDAVDTQESKTMETIASLKALIALKQLLGGEASQEEIAALQEKIREEEKLGEDALNKLKEDQVKETEDLKTEFEERTSELENKITTDEELLTKHAEVIKKINRDVLKDDIEKLVENHQERLVALNEQIAKEKTKMMEGGENFGGVVGGMGADWDELLNDINGSEIDWDGIVQPLTLESIG